MDDLTPTTAAPDPSEVRKQQAAIDVLHQLAVIPLGQVEGANRYDTDDEHVLTVWVAGETWDVRWPKGSDFTDEERRHIRKLVEAVKTHAEDGQNCPVCGPTNGDTDAD